MLSLGKGPIYLRSCKQKIVTRSSTEAELVAISDALSQIIWGREFLKAQGINCGPAILYQDNLSTMALVEKGRSTSDRTRHINVRYFFIKDKVTLGEIIVKHMRTDILPADILTKGVQGGAFIVKRKGIMNN